MHCSSTNTKTIILCFAVVCTRSLSLLKKNSPGQGYSFAVTDGNFLFPRSIVNDYNFTETLLFLLKKFL